jgi:Mn2+/Fe2+ NRAMP family transporter
MAAMLLIAQQVEIMGPNAIGTRMRIGGWFAVALMAAVTFVMLGTAITNQT